MDLLLFISKTGIAISPLSSVFFQNRVVLILFKQKLKETNKKKKKKNERQKKQGKEGRTSESQRHPLAKDLKRKHGC